MKKSIGVITYHRAYNFGSFLQAYALQYYLLKKLNVYCEIIDYQKPEQKEFYKVMKKNNSIKNILKNIYALNHKKELVDRNNKFEKMIKAELILSDEFKSLEELKKVKEYDLLICGSDQIWNTNILDFDEAYLLSFSNKNKKISYAASMGGYPSISTKNIEIFKENLCKFNAISVREISAKKCIEEYCNIDISVCVDPTLLINEKAYNSLIKNDYLNVKLPKEKFIFFYSVCYNEDMIDRVIKFSDIAKLPVYMVYTGSLKISRCSKKGINIIYDASVSDFLYLIKNSEYVFSSSFHGTVFSLIFKKEFFVINEYKNGRYLKDERMKCLLQELNIDYRMTNNSINFNDKIDYSLIDDKLRNLIKSSKEFLKVNIGVDNV